MYTLRKVLADVIRKGEVSVNFPEVDIDELQRAIHTEAQATLHQIAYIVYNEEIGPEEKVTALQDILDEW